MGGIVLLCVVGCVYRGLRTVGGAGASRDWSGTMVDGSAGGASGEGGYGSDGCECLSVGGTWQAVVGGDKQKVGG